MKGVEKVESGYSGGTLEKPTYEQVSTGMTGYAEVVQITFDSDVISFKELLEIFFSTHNPTTLNRQGQDVGTQYRSVIFYHDDKQKAVAKQVIKEISEEKTFELPIVTQPEPFKTFYKAEDYHKDYFKRHPEQSYYPRDHCPKTRKAASPLPEQTKASDLRTRQKRRCPLTTSALGTRAEEMREKHISQYNRT